MSSAQPDRDRFEQLVQQGNEALRIGHAADAVGPLRDALQMDTGNARVMAMLGLAFFRSGQFAEAKTIYATLVNRAPRDPGHRLNLGLVLLKLGEAAAAIAMLEASRALDPSSLRTITYLGLAYARAGRFTDAYRAFLLSGDNDLALEVESNLSDAEKQAVVASLPARAVRTTLPPPLATQASTDSDRFVAPASTGIVAQPSDDSHTTPIARTRNAISRAVADAGPAMGHARAVMLGGHAGEPPGVVPLSTFATVSLLHPQDAGPALEVTTDGLLVMRVTERLIARLDGVVVQSGAISAEPATRRVRGQQTAAPFVCQTNAFFALSGTGYLVVAAADLTFTALLLDDDILYLREDVVFAFDPTLRWENGNVPGLRDKFGVVQFRGDGTVALATQTPLMRVKLSPNAPAVVATERLAGWIGRVIPRAIAHDHVTGGAVECSGEGVLLISVPRASAHAPTARFA